MTTPTVKTNIVSPRITEKAALLQDKGCYVFNIKTDATKNEVAKEIESIYKVKPVKVNIAKAAGKKRFFRGRVGNKPGVKKAYVYLKDGDKISIV